MTQAAMTILDKNREFLKEKSFSYGISLLLVLILLPQQVGSAYIILGLAHYAMTALYQFKNNKITLYKFAIFAAATFGLFILGFELPRFFTVFTSAFLLFHVFSGEVRHFNRQYTLPYFILTVSLVILLCSWLSIELWGFNMNMLWICCLLCLPVFVACCLYCKVRKYSDIDGFFPFLVLLFSFFVAAEIFQQRPTAFESFGFIVIAHYLTTYFNVTRNFSKRSPQKMQFFVLESAAINFIFIAGFVATYSFFDEQGFLFDYFYNPIAFYVWTVMHFLSTWNNNDYKFVMSQKSEASA